MSGELPPRAIIKGAWPGLPGTERWLKGQILISPPRSSRKVAVDRPADSSEPPATGMPVPACISGPLAVASVANNSPRFPEDWAEAVIENDSENENTSARSNREFESL